MFEKKILLLACILVVAFVLSAVPCAKALVTEEGSTAEAAQPAYKEGELIVKFKRPVADVLERQLAAKVKPGALKLSSSLDSLNSKHKARAIEPIFKNFKASRKRMQEIRTKDPKSLNRLEKKLFKRLARAPKGAKIPELDRIYKVKLEPGKSATNAVREYKADPAVEYAELNYIVSICSTEPNDPCYPVQWPLANLGQMYPASGRFREPPGTVDCDIDANEAWDIHTGSSEVVVAVIDTGVDYNHRDLQGNMWVDSNGYYGYDFINDDNDPMDDNGHGTHCAGIIAARTDNFLDIAGVSWNAKIMAVKFLSAYGSGYGDDGANSIYYATDNGADILSNSWGGPDSNTIEEAVNYAVGWGVIVVASAGNKNSTSPSYPAYYDGVISVAATDSNDDKASFSNYGDWVDIAAPGVDVLSLRGFLTRLGTTHSDKLTILSGTSMACPHVSGVCALLLSINSYMTSDNANTILRNESDELDDPDICASGRVNAYKAILGAVSPKGYVNLDKPYYNCETAVVILVSDQDLAGDGIYDVNIATSGGDLETVELLEVDSNVGIFIGSISTEPGDPYTDGKLQVADGNTIMGMYYDANTGTGSSAFHIDTALVDCVSPTISNISFSAQLVGPEQIVTFETNELSTSRVECGTSCGASSIVSTYLNPQFYHTIKLTGMTPSTDYFFSIEVMDQAGNTIVDSNSGNCYWFVTDEGPRDINVPADYNTIQEAIDVAWDGSTVWLADGTYTGAGNRDIDFRGRAITLKSVNGPDYCVIDCNGSPNEPHRGFMFVNEEGSSSVIDGLTVKNGRALQNDFAPWCVQGGGIYILCGDPAINNCVFTDNNCIADIYDPNKFMTNSLHSGGGAIYNGRGKPQISYTTFVGNYSYDYFWASLFPGGGAIRDYFGTATITECQFTSNSANASAGAIYSWRGSPVITDCNFTDNLSVNVCGALKCKSGKPVIQGCKFADNSANFAGAASIGIEAEAVISDCMFERNRAIQTSAGAINVSEGSCEITGCKFIDNDANIGGGAILISQGGQDGGTQKIRNCVFVGNDANDGGAIHSIYRNYPEIYGCTFYSNTANKGAGIYYLDHSIGTDSSTLSNCILWAKDANELGDQIYIGSDWDVNVSFCDIEGSGGSGDWDPNFGNDLGGNIDADPCFVDEDSNDYHLDPNSICIDAGDPNFNDVDERDIDGAYRIVNDIIDMGADEQDCYPLDADNYADWVFFGRPDCWCYPRQCYGDADGLQEVNEPNAFYVWNNDLAILQAAWLKSAEELEGNEICADFDRAPEGKVPNIVRVGTVDLTILMSHWMSNPDPNCDPGNIEP